MKTKIMFAICVLLLIAMMVPTGAIASIINFEAPYTSGIRVVGQDGWLDYVAAGDIVSAASPVSGSQSAEIGAGTLIQRAISVYNRTTISYLVRLNSADASAMVYFFHGGNGFIWNAFAAGGASYNVAGVGDDAAFPSVGNWTDNPMVAGHVYKVEMNIVFSYHIMTISMYDVANPGVVWTKSDIPMSATIYSKDAIDGIGLANWGTGTVSVDDISITETAFTSPPVQTDPIAHYTFNDGAGRIVADSSGGHRDGTIVGSENSWGSDLLNFDNNTNYINCGSESELGIANDMSFVAWIKWSLVNPWFDTNYGLFDDNVGGASGQTLRIDGDGRLTYLSWATPLDYQGVPGMVTDKTYQIGFVRSGTTVSMYVNGALRTDYNLGDASVAMYPRNDALFQIGGGFKGQFMDAKIYNRAITGEEILTQYTDVTYLPIAGPVAHYTFDDGAGTKVTDVTGNGNPGIISGTPTWDTGKLTFINQNGSVACGTEANLGISNDMTYTGLVKWTLVDPWFDTNYTLFSSNVDNDTGQDLRIDGDGRLTYLSWLTGAGLGYQGIPGMVAGNTYHIGYVRSGTTVSMYVNGVHRTDYNLGNGTVDMYDRNNAQFSLGKGYFCGDMMDVQIYNHALTSDSIMYLNNNPGLEYVLTTGVSLNKTSLSLGHLGTETLVASVTPDNATNQAVTWSSDNESVATVDSSGLVTVVGVFGQTCNITATTNDGGFTASCQVVIYIPGPVAHYVFKDGEGTTVTDISGFGHNGTISGNPVWGTDKLTFINQDGSVACGTETNLSIVNDMTYTGLVKWVLVDPWLDTNYTLFSSSVDNDTGQDLRIDGDGRLTYLSWLTSDGLGYQGVPGLVAGNTYHIGYVRAGNSIKMYVNGVLRTDYSLGNGTVDMYDRNTSQFRLGNGYFCGDMMDVQLYNRALTDVNISYLYNNPGNDVLGGHYELPVLPTMNYSDEVTVDGDLSDWSDATFTAMDKAYYPDPSVNLDMSNAAYSFKWGAGGTKVYLALRVQDAEPVWNNEYTGWNVNDHVETQLWASGVSGAINQKICDIAQQYELGLQEDGFGTWTNMCGEGVAPDFANLNFAITQGVDGWVFYEVAMSPFTAFNRLDVNEVVSRALVGGDVIGADAVIASMNVWADFNMIAADTKVGKSANTSAIQKRQLVREGVAGSVGLQNYEVSSLGIAGTATITDGTNTEIHNIVLDSAGAYSFATALRGDCTVIVKCTHWLGKAVSVNVDVTGNGNVALLSVINGDVVESNEVDFDDINATRAAYGSFPGDENWNARADVDGTGEVDFSDINIVRGKYGEIGE